MKELDSFAVVEKLELLLDQLYYWARRADETRRTAGDAALAGRMLQTATAELEGFVTTLLDCFRPLALAPTRMAVSDVVSAIAIRARGELGAASVTVTGEPDGTVSVDTGQFTRALSAILRRLDPFGTALQLAVAPAERGGRHGVELSIRCDGKAPRSGKADIDWMLARRIVALHAGELEERPGPRSAAIVLFLPPG